MPNEQIFSKIQFWTYFFHLLKSISTSKKWFPVGNWEFEIIVWFCQSTSAHIALIFPIWASVYPVKYVLHQNLFHLFTYLEFSLSNTVEKKAANGSPHAKLLYISDNNYHHKVALQTNNIYVFCCVCILVYLL